LQINIFLIILLPINHQSFYMRLKYLFFSFYLITNCCTSFAQNVGIGTTTPDSSAALDITSSSKGLLIPRLTLAQRPTSPANGLLYFQTDNTPGIYIFNGTSWNLLGSGGLSGSGTDGRLALFSGTNALTSNAGLNYNATAGRLDVNSTNDGTGFSNWIAGNFGGTAGNRVVTGILNGEATIGAHLNDLSNWAKLVINPAGATAIGSLAGTGVRMVTTAADGTLGFQEIPAGAGGTVTNVSADAVIGNPITIANGSTTPTINIPVATASANGYLSSSNWTTFNNKQNALSNAAASVSGILTSTDWNTFNNKQNALSNASASVSGILTSTDWNTFNNKFTLPSLTTGSVLFSNGTTIAQNNNQFFWNNATNRLGIGTATPNSKLSVNGLNTGLAADGYNNWITADFGGAAGNRVVLGIQNGEATVAAHSAGLAGWAGLTLNPAGAIKMPSIANVGNRMVTVNTDGTLASQAIPTDDNLGNHTATTNINLASNKLVGNSGTAGIAIANNGNVALDAALYVTGVTTLNNLAGTGNRMVIANNAGTLSTQAIPISDNLGNHTATQSINLANNWISNDGTSKGLKINNTGSVGVQVSNPVGTFDVGTAATSYSGTFGPNFAIPSGAYSFSSGFGTTPSNAFDNNDNTRWIGSSSLNNQIVGMDLGAGNTKVLRRYKIYCEGVAPTDGDRASWLIQASDDGNTWVTIDTRTNISFNLYRYVSLNVIWTLDMTYTISNSTPYRHYRIMFTSFIDVNDAVKPFLTGLDFFEENSSTSFSSGAFTVLPNGNTGVGTNAPTANLDVVGSLRLRNGAANNAILTSDANGNATWNTALSLNSSSIANLGVGVAAPTSNKLEVGGTGGAKISSSNNGTGTTDWIASNVGGTAGDRVVSGILGGSATIGAHNNALNAWSNLAINPTSTSQVAIGASVGTPPIVYNTTLTNGINPNLVVNGSIRQGYYGTSVSIPANSAITVTWNHNFGYNPIIMTSLDQTGGSFMDFCTVSSTQVNSNRTDIIIRNLGGNTANGALRWILVW
jgi:hypothetical protein